MKNISASRAFTESRESKAHTKDVLLAVSGAIRGDAKSARFLVNRAHKEIKKRVRRELGSIGKSSSGTKTAKSKIKGARPGRAGQLSPFKPLSGVRIEMPDGRRVRVLMSPSIARHRDLASLRRMQNINIKRAFDAANQNGLAINQLAAAQRELGQRLSKLQSGGDLALLRGLVEGLGKLEKRMEEQQRVQKKQWATHKRSVQKKYSKQSRALQTQKRLAQIQKLHSAVISVQSAAFGKQGSLVAGNNILLAANFLGWSSIAEILQFLGLAKPGKENLLVSAAPLASLVTSQLFLGKRQHKRFVTGVAKEFNAVAVPGPGFAVIFAVVSEARLSLRAHIAPSEWKSFSSRTNIAVSTTLIQPSPTQNAGITTVGEVSNGELIIRVGAPGPAARFVVSWTVDTEKPDG